MYIFQKKKDPLQLCHFANPGVCVWAQAGSGQDIRYLCRYLH